MADMRFFISFSILFVNAIINKDSEASESTFPCYNLIGKRKRSASNRVDGGWITFFRGKGTTYEFP